MRFDAPEFARGWLSTAIASATDKKLVLLDRTVAIEEFPNGVRFVATDRYVLLTAWVPSADALSIAEPDLDEAPDRVVVARDGDGRGKSLLNYVLTLWRRMLDGGDVPADGGSIELNLTFDVRLPAGEAPETFEGMEPTYVVLEVPDTEKVYLEVVEAEYPSWRDMVHGFTPETTKVIAFYPERLHRLGKLANLHDCPLEWTFGGSTRAALVDLPESEPHVQGLVMPARWVTEHDETPTDDGDAES